MEERTDCPTIDLNLGSYHTDSVLPELFSPFSNMGLSRLFNPSYIVVSFPLWEP